METPGQVFISYCTSDAEFAKRICERLEARGFKCWIAPRNIPPGQDWPAAIQEAIQKSGNLVLLLSSHSPNSKQIGREVGIADQSGVRIINFRLEDVNPPPAVAYFLNNLQWVDGFGARFESGVETLANALLNAPAPAPPKLPQPGRQKRRYPKLAVSLLIALGLTLLMQWAEYDGWFAGANGKIFDGILNGQVNAAGAAENAVAVLEIDNEAFQNKACFNGTSPLSPAVVMSLVGATLAAGPRVVGVDIFTESDQYRSMKIRANDPIVIWMAGAEAGSFIEVAKVWRWLLGGHERIVVKPTKVLGYEPGELAEHREIHWGVPAFPRDDDFTIRRLPRRIEASADPRNSNQREVFPSWARQIAEEYCRGGAHCTDEAADEVYVSYGGAAPEELKMLDYFDCGPGGAVKLRGTKANELKALIEGKALLIGGTFSSGGQLGDFHETPKGLLAGVVINAYAVRAEIEGNGLQDVSEPWAAMLDFGIGVLIVMIFYGPLFLVATRSQSLMWLRKHEFRCMIVTSFLILAVFFALIRWQLGGAYFMGIAGVFAGVLLHQIIEIQRENPQRREVMPG